MSGLASFIITVTALFGTFMLIVFGGFKEKQSDPPAEQTKIERRYLVDHRLVPYLDDLAWLDLTGVACTEVITTKGTNPHIDCDVNLDNNGSLQKITCDDVIGCTWVK